MSLFVLDKLSVLSSLCESGHDKTALFLLNNFEIDPGRIDVQNTTPLYWACSRNMPKLAMALIATGRSKPGHKPLDKNNHALILACQNQMITVALALIATGQSKPEYVNSNRRTALIYACKYGLSEVALALIETGNSNHMIVDNYNKTALSFARKNKLTKVVEKLNTLIVPDLE